MLVSNMNALGTRYSLSLRCGWAHKPHLPLFMHQQQVGQAGFGSRQTTQQQLVASALNPNQEEAGGEARAPAGYDGVKQRLQQWSDASRKQASKLKDFGLAGVIAYGALNTLYYTIAFVVCWLCWADVPRGQGIAAAATAFLKVFATVWAGSQVTKLARAAGALMLAPFMDRALDFATSRFGFKTKRRAFLAFLGICIMIALCVFSVIVVAWQ